MIGCDQLGGPYKSGCALEAVRIDRLEAKALRRPTRIDLRPVAGNAVVVALRQRAEPRREIVRVCEPLGKLEERRVALGDLGADLLGRRTEASVVIHGGRDHVRAP